MAIAATRDPQLAYKAGFVSATEARAIGITVDFYPVLDVNNNPRNPIINIRSFGEDVGLVSEMGDRLHARHPGRRRARHGEALPGPRRHQRRHPPRPREDRPPARASRPGRAAAVPRGGGRGHRRVHVHAHHPAGARPGARHPGHAQPADPHRAAARRDEVRRPHLHRLDVDERHLEELRQRQGGGDGGQGRRGLRPPLAGRRRGVQGDQGGGGIGRDRPRSRWTSRCCGSSV